MAPSIALPSLSGQLDGTVGAVLLGLVGAAMLFGMTCVQSTTYFQSSSSRDPLFMKSLVGLLWFIDAIHLALIIRILYNFVVTNFMHPSALSVPTISLSIQIIVASLSDLVVRSFYARRVWILSGFNTFLTMGSITFTFSAFVASIGFAASSFTFISISDMMKIAWVVYLAFGASAVSDIWIAASLCYYLRKNRLGITCTESKFDVLLMYIVNSGALTAVFAIACFVTFCAMPNNYIFFGFYFILSKLFFNSLLATLNARERMREGLGIKNEPTYTLRVNMAPNMPSLFSPRPTTSSSFGTPYSEKDSIRSPLAVSIRTETDYKIDDFSNSNNLNSSTTAKSPSAFLPNHATSPISPISPISPTSGTAGRKHFRFSKISKITNGSGLTGLSNYTTASAFSRSTGGSGSGESSVKPESYVSVLPL